MVWKHHCYTVHSIHEGLHKLSCHCMHVYMLQKHRIVGIMAVKNNVQKSTYS